MSSVFKMAIGEAGVGSGNYPVIQDYIRFCSKKKYSEFDLPKKV
jgi:hypothetical protein